MNLTDLYRLSATEGGAGDDARTLLEQTHWYLSNTDFDPKTGEALVQPLSVFLGRISIPETGGAPCRDRLWRIMEHARLSLERLFRKLVESPRREHAVMPIRSVRELDAGCFIKLSNYPGRNIREKLAGRPYLQAVRRFQSVDIPENRLVKAFAGRLVELLELRAARFGGDEEGLLAKTRSWLLSDEAQVISRWGNTPPNNALLSHRDYRRIWDAWRWLQTLDEDIANDYSRLRERSATMKLWKQHGRIYCRGSHRFADMPLLFDYENFGIAPWLPHITPRREERKIARGFAAPTFSPACVDFVHPRPIYAVIETGRNGESRPSSKELPITVVWQRWKRDADLVELPFFQSDAIYRRPDVVTVLSTDVFFPGDTLPEHLDLAARAFVVELRNTFKHNTLFWLIPDSVNDFELETMRRNLNARFPDAEPLPRSVAAVFESVDYSGIKSEGYSVVVVDPAGGVVCATKLIAKFDPDLKKRLPETAGFYWERCPPVLLSRKENNEVEGEQKTAGGIVTVDANGRWEENAGTDQGKIEPDILRMTPRLGAFDKTIYLGPFDRRPAAGGIRLHAMQQRAEDIPLWRDQIPELSIKAIKDGRYQTISLVSRDTTVRPIRGMPVNIPVEEKSEEPLELPPGKQFYQFPLFQGGSGNAADLGFSARLDSPDFPLKTAAKCRLRLSFTYGADDPYVLVFEAMDNSFSPVRATWRRAGDMVVSNAPAPEYPTPSRWTELRRMPKPNSTATSDLLDWVISAIDNLCEYLYIHSKKREPDVIDTRRLRKESGAHDAFGHSDPSHLVDGFDDKAIKRIHRSLYFPLFHIWNDGRSISDKDCPRDFENNMHTRISCLDELLGDEKMPVSIKNEIFFLLSCIHKDTTEKCVHWLETQAKNDKIGNPRAIGYALGDLSKEWQRNLFNSLIARSDSSIIRIFAHAIWRERNFVNAFSFVQLNHVLDVVMQCLKMIKPIQGNAKREEHVAFRNSVKAKVEPLELLLGLLRTRASANQEIKMLLQPHQKITKKILRLIDSLSGIIAQNDIELFSRIRLTVPAPEGDKPADLLHALRLYLSGDDGANAIYVASVRNEDNDPN